MFKAARKPEEILVFLDPPEEKAEGDTDRDSGIFVQNDLAFFIPGMGTCTAAIGAAVAAVASRLKRDPAGYGLQPSMVSHGFRIHGGILMSRLFFFKLQLFLILENILVN